MTETQPGFIDFNVKDNPEPTAPYASLQWKNTDACFSFTCECGAEGHFDGYFGSHVRCGKCGTAWEMPCYLYPRKVGEKSYPHDPKPLVMDEDEEEGE